MWKVTRGRTSVLHQQPIYDRTRAITKKKPLVSEKYGGQKSGQKKRKPHGYWKKIENVKNEVLKLAKNGLVPKSSDPAVSVIVVILHIYHKTTYEKFVKELELKIDYGGKKPRGYWQDIENVKNEVLKLAKNGVVPTSSDPAVSVIACVLSRHHGTSYKQIVKMLGLKVELGGKKERGYWQKIKNVKKEIRALAVDGVVPNSRNPIVNVISSVLNQHHNTTYGKLVKKMGLKIEGAE